MYLLSNGYFPSEFIVHHLDEVPNLFVIYGIGFTLISSLFSLLFYQGWINSEALSLNKQEIVDTRIGITAWAICSITGLIASMFAAITPSYIGVFGGFIYSTLPITIYFSTKRINKYS